MTQRTKFVVRISALLTAAVLAFLFAPATRAAIAVDANVSVDQSPAKTTVASPAFSTTSGNELLLAFIETDYLSGSNTTVTSVSGAGLTWVLVLRTNVQSGSSEIWRAFAPSTLSNVSVTATLSQSVVSSMTVISFSGVNTSGTNGSGAIGATKSANSTGGAPTASLVTTQNNSWVFGVGNDYDNAIGRTVPSGQSLVHQYLTPTGDTYWVQMQNAPTPTSGTTVKINDTAPTGDRYNLSICEILPAVGGSSTFSLSGTVSPAASGSGVTITLSGTANATTTTDSSGNYSFANLANGAYTVTPGKTGFTFSPTSQSVTINGANSTGNNFTATSTSIWSISGTISPATSGVTVALSGTATASTTTDASGNYSFSNLANGSYAVTPSKTGFTFNPTSQSVTINGANSTGNNFTATSTSIWSISGTVSPATSGVTVALSGTATASTTTDASGNYSFSNLANGPYTVTPTKSGFTLSPANRAVTISGANATGVNFTASPTTWSISGTISPASSGSGTLVTLSGAANATTTADSSGNYTFANLANGSYTVTPTKSGFTFSPVNQAVTINGANSTGNNFTATSTAIFSISGAITPATVGSGAVVTLSGAATGTATADNSGNYSFSNLANGTYTLTPSKSGYTFTPTSQSVTINGASVTATTFTGQASTSSGVLALDVQASTDGASASSTIKTAAFSTKSANELLLAFIATDYLSGANTTVTGVTGGGLTWVLVVRTNTQSGSSEIWRAFAPAALSGATVTATLSQSVVSSITVVSFTGADATGTNGAGAIGAIGSANAGTGAPKASLVTTRNGSWVFGVGNDFDNAIARTPASGQSLEHQYLTPTGDTYWVQMQNSATPASGTTVSINDTAPTGDRYNLSIVEVVPATSGGTVTPPTISMASPAANATVSGKTNVTANATDTSYAITGVQFILDGVNLGSQVTIAPYALTWDTTTITAGSHTLSATVTDSGGQSATSAPITVTVDNSGAATVVGSWSSPVSIPTVAVNLILLKNNTLLFYEDGVSPTVWDYTNNIFTNISTSADLFCSGHAALSDGRILVVGGYGGSSSKIGIPDAEIFDPAKNTWTTVPKMSFSRWYPTATTLSDGRVLVTAGWQTTNHSNAGIPEIYDPTTNTWTKLASANNPFETYPFVFMLNDGRVIHVGGSEYATNTDILDVNAQTWTVVDSRILDGGSATMYRPGLIMKAGSATDSQGTGPSSNTTYVLDTTQPSPAWVQTPSMAYARSFMNLTELPDGTVLATGGESDKNGGNIANAVYAAELWSPSTQTWTTMSSMHTPREYHSTALLLPDGRVLQSGMGADFGNVPDEMNAEFFSPPYLFKGARPTITQAPTQIQYGVSFFVGTPDAANIKSAVLIRTGAVTHFFDQNTRYVPVTMQQASGGLTLTAPANSFQAPPGYYMLFLVNNNGVPSIAPFMQLTQ
jgi:hypothetical protein